MQEKVGTGKGRDYGVHLKLRLCLWGKVLKWDAFGVYLLLLWLLFVRERVRSVLIHKDNDD